MPNKFNSLPATRLESGMSFESVEHIKERPAVLHMGDSALDAMIDLQYTKILHISPEKKMYDARVEMQAEEDLHLIFVVDDNQKLVGFLSLEKIITDAPIKEMEKNRVKREELLVKHVMRPLDEVTTLFHDDLRFAKVGDVVQTLKQEKQHYAIVMKKEDDAVEPTICGVFMAAIMSEQLGMDVVSDQPSRAETIAELNQRLAAW